MQRISCRTNYDDVNLYCVECKQKIVIGEKYAILFETLYNDEEITKALHLDCLIPEDDESDDDSYFLGNQDD